MKTLFKITLIFAVAISVLSCKAQKDTITISGKFNIPKVKEIYLLRADKNFDPYRDTTTIKIPIIDSAFYYEIKRPKEPIVLELTYSTRPGTFRDFPLFIKNSDIEVIVNGTERDERIIKGGKLHEEYDKYYESISKAFEKEYEKIKPFKDSDKALEKEFIPIRKKIIKLTSELKNTKEQAKKDSINKQLTELNKQKDEIIEMAKSLWKKLNKMREPIYLKQKDFKINYIQNNPTFVSYYFLLDKLDSYDDIFPQFNIDINKAKELYAKLKKEFPNHSYNKRIEYLIDKIENVRIGKPFIDFSAPDLNGKEHKLSNEIKGKVALLDLWATWCGGCIRKTKSMIPLYNQFKNKGFTIVGVAGEFKNTDNLVKFLEKEKWPWLNLVELDRKNNIWKKYGIETAGGSTYLIDKNGIIIAINPTAEQVKKELEKRLK